MAWIVVCVVVVFGLATTTNVIGVPLQCDLYLAESTIPNAGQGLFTGIAKLEGDTIGNGDKALPIIDLYWHNGDYYDGPDPPPVDKAGNIIAMDPTNPHRRLSDALKDSQKKKNKDDDDAEERKKASHFASDAPDFFNQFGDYVWVGSDMGMQYESVLDDVTAFWPGVDALVNCNAGLSNVKKATPVYSTDGLHRSTHPGAGAISYYGAGPTYVMRDIPVGGEIFKYYGDSWFTTRTERFGNLPLGWCYEHIIFYTTKLQEFGATLDKRLKEDVANGTNKKVDLKKDSKFSDMAKLIYDELLQPIKEVWDVRLFNALHDYSWDDIKLANEKNDMGVLVQRSSTRSIEWLNENGKCVDHIIQGQSTIDGAGQGGFAKRFLPKGTIITGTPLLQIPDREQFVLYDAKQDKDRDGEQIFRRVIDSVRGKQLMYNYCFGHPESSVLLCPDGPGVNYINHASNRTSNDKQPNVRVQWAKDGMTSHKDEWLKKHPDDMYVMGSHLAFDYVALRDIEKGEELLMDYGPAWENAWEDHVKKWFQSEAADPSYISARDMNSTDAPIRTIEEQKINPYPTNLLLVCHISLAQKWNPSKEITWNLWDHGTPCEILSRRIDEKGDERYEIIIKFIQHNPNGDKEIKNLVKDVPRAGIKFLDRQYTTDLHLRQAFRHFIGIPDDIIPQQWLNLRPDDNDEGSCVGDDGEGSQECAWK